MSSAVEKVFSANLAYIFGDALPKTVAIALSGGVDSMSLIHLLDKYRHQHGKDMEISTVTVNHNLRQNSEEEAHAVGKIMSRLGVKHEIYNLEWPEGKDNISAMEKQARVKRYMTLQRYCHEGSIGHVMTGHHLDDQLETFLQRLRYGSSVFGLRGMKMLSHMPVADVFPPSFVKPVQVARPLLNITKQSLVEYCREHNHEWFEDPTNSDAKVTYRNGVRQWLNDPAGFGVPEILQKNALLTTMKQVVAVGNDLDRKVEGLQSYLKERGLITGILNTMSITVVLPEEVFSKYDHLVINRFLYRTCFMISPSTQFAYKFSKFDSSFDLTNNKPMDLADNLRQTLQTGEPAKFTLMNLNWKVTARPDKSLEIKLSRESQRSYQDSKAQSGSSMTLPIADSEEGLYLPKDGEWSEWFLFDNRCWMRMRLLGSVPEGLRSFRISNFSGKVSDLEGIFEEDLVELPFSQHKLQNQPIITYTWKDDESREKIAGFPTWNTWSKWIKDRVEVKWRLKGEYEEGKPMVFADEK
ncbi:unnamed protein product [Kuraishia capsulata CBS 1993]|uniref:tRNA(Ile)-lysidine synthetase n=1 Tax=Kuraishia capsulata CBS 1993 TaxID=1382522 RepID=W6MX89_9ASCO|nr:uncharacterized protein KUCA_T00004453001 [Kuraishia capsulata CBS 1993]CDK28470.1 unnamed protein product [Kuraishia capsulata CBS 1993]